MIVKINLVGCDDETEICYICTEIVYQALLEISELSMAVGGGCKPRMFIEAKP